MTCFRNCFNCFKQMKIIAVLCYIIAVIVLQAAVILFSTKWFQSNRGAPGVLLWSSLIAFPDLHVLNGCLYINLHGFKGWWILSVGFNSIPSRFWAFLCVICRTKGKNILSFALTFKSLTQSWKSIESIHKQYMHKPIINIFITLFAIKEYFKTA